MDKPNNETRDAEAAGSGRDRPVPGTDIAHFNPAAVYIVAFVCFAAFLVLSNGLGWDWIPGHVTPFYAMFHGQAPNLFFLFPVVFAALFIALLVLVFRGTMRVRPGYLLCILVMCGTVLHLLVAMMDGGPEAISVTFTRWGYEYFGDVPAVRNPIQFLRDYVELMPHLSMHSRVHPPGPVLMLWFITLFTGRDPLAASIGSIAVSNLTIVPLYYFARRVFDDKTALYSVLLYLFAPTVVMFTATSVDTFFCLFTAGSFCFFAAAMERDSRLSAALAGLSFALAILMSFNLAVLGLFFAVVGLKYLTHSENRARTFQCLAIMAGAFILFYLLAFAVGYNVSTCFAKASAQLRTDVINQDLYTPRAPYIIWRIGTPIAVLFFAGIPAAGLFALWTRRGISGHNPLSTVRDSAAYYVGFLATLIAFDLLYFGRGEGERAWVFLLPFIIAPAGALIARRTAKPDAVLLWTLGVTFVQTFVMEALLFTYW
jgi:hypothetical protein